MVRKEDATVKAKKPATGRARKEPIDEAAYRKLMVQQTKAQSKLLRAMKAMIGQIGGGRHYGKQCMFGSYFLPMWGLPGADGVMAEANRLLTEWTSEGWYPVHVTSQKAELDFQGGVMRGQDVTILWGHD